MPTQNLEALRAYLATLRAQAAKSQADARRTLNPLFRERDRRTGGPRDFIESSYLFLRACDADVGSRPAPCPVFWLSPDLRAAPVTDLGAHTTALEAGRTYRFTATVRNKGDLHVPACTVEFWLVTPSLGFDTRFATKLGVASGRVMAYGATEIAIDYTVPPTVAGHRCLFARAFSFSPLDLPLDDYALDPRYDRHIAQRNLEIVAQASTLTLDWVHAWNARERVEIVPMTAAQVRALRLEAASRLTILPGTRWRAVAGQAAVEVQPAEGARVRVEPLAGGIQLESVNPEGASLDAQAAMHKALLGVLREFETGRGDRRAHGTLLREYRAMRAQTTRSQLRLTLPGLDLARGQALPVHVQKRDLVTGAVSGGVSLLVTGGS